MDRSSFSKEPDTPGGWFAINQCWLALVLWSVLHFWHYSALVSSFSTDWARRISRGARRWEKSLLIAWPVEQIRANRRRKGTNIYLIRSGYVSESGAKMMLYHHGLCIRSPDSSAFLIDDHRLPLRYSVQQSAFIIVVLLCQFGTSGPKQKAPSVIACNA